MRRAPLCLALLGGLCLNAGSAGADELSELFADDRFAGSESAASSSQSHDDSAAPSPGDGDSGSSSEEPEIYAKTIPVGRQEDLPVDAPAPSRRAIEEIVVTAQRREQSLQDVPVSVSAFSEDMIAERNITMVNDVALTTPGFVMAQSFGQVAPTIRGIGADRFTMSSEPGVALYVDDVYLGRPYLPQAAMGQIQRIEVLKGPQGTLYGRNTSGGAVKIVTRRPTQDTELSASLQLGNYDQITGKASLAGPLTDTLTGRISGFIERRDGYTYNATLDKTVDAHEAESGRISLDWAPTDWLDVALNGDLNHQFDTGPVAYANGAVTFSVAGDRELAPSFEPLSSFVNPLLALLEPGDPLLDQLSAPVLAQVGGNNSTEPRTVYQDFASFTEIDSSMASLTATVRLDELQIKLIGGYADSRRDFPMDADLTDFAGLHLLQGTTSANQVSAELQFSSDFAMPWDGNLHWLAGGFYYKENAWEILDFEVYPLFRDLGLDAPGLQDALNAVGDLIPPGTIGLLGGEGIAQVFFRTRQITDSVAAFVDLEWELRHWLILHLGGRYTQDTKTLLERSAENADPRNSCANETGEETFEATTLRAGIDLPWDNDRMVYLTYSEGFKAGGFSGVSCGAEAYRPEYVTSLELGLKSQWLDGLLQLNMAAFDYQFDDIQVEKVVGLGTEVVNAAEATIRGAEMELRYLPFDFLSLDIGVGYLDATYGEFFDDDPYTQLSTQEEDLSGNRLNKSPEWSGSVGLDLKHYLRSGNEAGARVEWAYTDDMFYDQFNHDFAHADAYEQWNAYVNWTMPERGLALRGFAKNLTDETYVSGQITASAIIGGPYVYYNMPRTYGVELSYQFGGQ